MISVLVMGFLYQVVIKFVCIVLYSTSIIRRSRLSWSGMLR